jgi:succinate dehydrogenase / fumarate reductase membrane anchor subunit
MTMDYRTPLKRAQGLGASHHGTSHWWMQRLSAVAMVPLMLWLVVGLATHTGGGYEGTVGWLGNPVNAVVLIIAFAVLFYHASLGLQVVLEDYVSHKGVRLALVTGVRFLAVLLAVSAIFALLTIAFGG